MMKIKNGMNLSRMIMKLAVLLILIMPAALIAQQRSLQDLMVRASAAGFGADRIAEIEQRAASSGMGELDLAALLEPAVELAEQNLPADFAIQKMMEGFSKNVPAGRMTPVLQLIREKTPLAASLADNWIEKSEVTVFMNSLGENQVRFRRDLVSANLKSLTQNVDAGLLEGVLNELGR